MTPSIIIAHSRPPVPKSRSPAPAHSNASAGRSIRRSLRHTLQQPPRGPASAAQLDGAVQAARERRAAPHYRGVRQGGAGSHTFTVDAIRTVEEERAPSIDARTLTLPKQIWRAKRAVCAASTRPLYCCSTHATGRLQYTILCPNRWDSCRMAA